MLGHMVAQYLVPTCWDFVLLEDLLQLYGGGNFQRWEDGAPPCQTGVMLMSSSDMSISKVEIGNYAGLLCFTEVLLA